MAEATTPTTEPATLIAGDTATWLKTVPGYPASAGWVLTYTLINASAKITITSAASGEDHLVNTPAASTTGWAPGAYTWQARVAFGANAHTVGQGTATVQAAFGSVSTLDARTHAAKTLAAIEAYLENGSNLAASEYEIAGRSLKRYPITDLLAMRDRYRAEVTSQTAAQRAAAGLPNNRRTFVRFGA
jgi:hypothetical protein